MENEIFLNLILINICVKVLCTAKSKNPTQTLWKWEFGGIEHVVAYMAYISPSLVKRLDQIFNGDISFQIF